MTVFFSVLTVIGKVILILLLIVLALLLLVLLVPVKYAGSVEGTRGRVDSGVEVTWLFRAAALRLRFHRADGENEIQRDFRIFGISPREMKEKARAAGRERRKAEKKRRLRKLKDRDPEEYRRLKEEARKRKEARKEEEARAAAECEIRRRMEEKARLETKKKIRETEDRRERRNLRRKAAVSRVGSIVSRISRAAEKAVEKIVEIIAAAFDRIFRLPEEIGSRIRSAADALRKAKDIASFAADRRTRDALARSLKAFFFLLRHYRPREISGKAVVGLGDPGLTGQLFGAACAFYPAYGRRFELIPDFEEAGFEGNVTFAGRIVIFWTVAQAVGLLLRGSVRYVIHYIRNSGKEEME